MGILLRKKLFDSRFFERVLEIIPGTLVWSALFLPIIIAYIAPVAVAVFIIVFDVVWTVRWFSLSSHLISGYREIRTSQLINWHERLHRFGSAESWIKELKHEKAELLRENRLLSTLPFLGLFMSSGRSFRDRRYINERALVDAEYIAGHEQLKDPQKIYHMVLLATFKEGLEILEPSTKAVTESNFQLERVVFVLAGESRDSENLQRNGRYLKEKYGRHFAEFYIMEHPDNPDEGRVKGSGISYAAKTVKELYFDSRGIDPSDIIVTALDSDTVVHKEFLPHLTYKYAINPNRKFRSFQPIPFFYNNIWDAPAPMRIISTGSSFWQVIESTRPQRLRNFSSHSQSLETLAEIDYWDRFSINDDSRQFWRTYFAFDGNHVVVPLFIPVFNDAVLSDTYVKTFKNQYLQLRRWAYGVSEFPYIVRHFLVNKKIKTTEKISKTFRLLEGHFSWATAPLFMAVVAWLPLFINSDAKKLVLFNKLPTITSWILTIGMSGLIITIWLSLLMMPPKPRKYRFTKRFAMIFQWLLLPITTIFFSSLPSIDAHTRLMFGRYMGFRVTEKARKSGA